MTWTVNSFWHKAKLWASYSEDSSTKKLPGHQYYANRQFAFWEHVADNALQSFQRALASAGEHPEIVLSRVQSATSAARTGTGSSPVESSGPRDDVEPEPRATELDGLPANSELRSDPVCR